jgi:hypothetical protein
MDHSPWQPSWMYGKVTGHNFGKGQTKKYHIKDCYHYDQWFFDTDFESYWKDVTPVIHNYFSFFKLTRTKGSHDLFSSFGVLRLLLVVRPGYLRSYANRKIELIKKKI